MYWLTGTVLFFIAIKTVHGQGSCEGGSCFPSTGDLLVGRGDMLKSSSTCGQNRPQTYCIVSHLENVQKCFECSASDPDNSHEVQNVITSFNDRLETWWQSENGKQDVTIQLDLEAEFQFTHTIMTFKTFRPAAMLIERSMDFGKTWAVYRYFAYDCERSFPGIPLWPPRENDDVICDSRYSQIEPSNQGEMIYRVLEPIVTIRDPYAPRIQNLLKITNLRFNFTELHTLGDDLLDAREDIKNKYYYALYELVVRGNCFCYGHADTCTPIRETSSTRINGSRMRPGTNTEVHGRCQCQHNTMGLNCEQCKPFYQDQPWRPAEAGMPHECQPCNCNNHATECHFDPAVYEATGRVSGGVCENCQHNTVGRQCEQCAPFYYQDPQKDIRDTTVCAECNCEVAGSLDGGICDSLTNPDQGMIAGQCRCKRFVEGPRCDLCKPGYYGLDQSNLDGCTACDCDSLGTLSGVDSCDRVTGQCNCKRYTTGRRCDMCLPQTWGMSALIHGCRECDCDIGGAYDNDCDQSSGQCRCRPNIHNRRCDLVVSGNFLPALDFYIFEAENAESANDVYKDIRTRDRPPVTWTGDGFMLVKEGGSIVFIVDNLPASMDYHLVLRYQSSGVWRHVGVAIDRPNRGNIPTRSPCGNTRPEDDTWMTSLPGPPTTHHDLGIICLEENYRYRVTVDLSRMGDEPFPDGSKPDILIDSLIVVPVHTNMEIFSGTVEGRERGDQFDELDCLNREMEVPDQRPEDECAGLLFSMSAFLHDGARPCNCDPQGSESSICDDWGGQCRCKRNVIGRRCDRCAPGTYGFGPAGCRPCDCNAQGSSSKFCNARTGQCPCHRGISGRRCDQCKAGFYLFPQCLSCSCNGHADTCDQVTGRCINCRDNTMGDHCETCITGYYGNPVWGSLDQCKACMCPGGPNSGRQHARGCRFDELSGQVQCFCEEGYAGFRCSECAPAYWGNPNGVNGICRPCECSGNVDPLDPGACDAVTGVCTGCLYNTAGSNCERCRDFYYGSAADRTCRACACNLLGTARSTCVGDQCQCDVITGQCDCLPNVSGRNCDQCDPNHWKLASGEGCEACNCNLENSDGPTCNEFTGQCSCVDGFGGRTCNDCAEGHFGNPHTQCYNPKTTASPPVTASSSSTTTTTTPCPDKTAPCECANQVKSTTAATTSTTPISTTPPSGCDCDPNGSVSGQCNSRTGQCECKNGVGGRTCSRCLRGFTGQVPNCEPCGECFDNWDQIINDLKERTEAAIARAREIGESGVTGGFEMEFEEIEKILDSIPLNFSSGQAEIAKLVDLIRKKLMEQEERLRDLELDMTRIRDSDTTVNADLDDLEADKKRLEDKLESLRAQKQNITKASPVAAFKEVQDAADASMKAEKAAMAATTDSGSLVEQSQAIRDDVERLYVDKKQEFDDKLNQVEDDLTARKTEIDELTVSQLNEDVCGKATEDCDEICGGAGCDSCGGVGCPGAVEFAEKAKSRAQLTQETLERKAEEISDLNSRVTTTKENAAEAKRAAQAAKDRAQEVEAKIRKQNGEIRNLIRDIRKFLNDDKSDPADIQTVAEQVLALSLPVDRAGIDELRQTVLDLVERLPDVDDVLSESNANLKIAQELLDEARKASASAETVASDVTAVVNALDRAEAASDEAEEAKTLAGRNIRKAEQKISEINSATSDLETQMDNIANTIGEYRRRLGVVEERMADSKLNVDAALDIAQQAQNIGREATEAINNKRELIDEATEIINEKKEKAERLDVLKKKAVALQARVDGYNEELDVISNSFTAFNQTLTEKNKSLENLMARAETVYNQINAAERYLRVCTS